MPSVYRNQQRIPGLRGKVQGGLAVVVDSPSGISALQKLIRSAAELPGDPIANAYNAINNAGSPISDWPGWRDSQTPGVLPLEEGPIHDPVRQLDAALELAGILWMGQSDDFDQIALAMALPNPGKRRLVLEAQRPMLLLDAGSVRARITSAGARVRQFGVALFPKAPSRRRGNLVEALRARSPRPPLPRLEGLSSPDLEGRQGVIVFLHGLMSSDAGTFDALVARIEKDNFLPHVYLVGWPHDTLARIKVNAQDLAELIVSRLGPSGLPLLFVCHSRGGLVARATAVKLIEGDPRWAERLIGAVTFGTPHLGAELAERGDEFLGKLLLLKAIRETGRSVPLIDALCAVYRQKKIEGISDLRPTSNGGKFLYRLREDEAKQAGGAGKRVLPMFVVGGRAEPAPITGWLSRRFFGGEPNDLVVALSSTAPPSMPPISQTATDHFTYFSDPEMQKPHIPALDFIVAAFQAFPLQDQSRSLPSKGHIGATRGGRASYNAPSQPRTKRLVTMTSSRR